MILDGGRQQFLWRWSPQHQEQGGNVGFSRTRGTGVRLKNTMFTGPVLRRNDLQVSHSNLKNILAHTTSNVFTHPPHLNHGPKFDKLGFSCLPGLLGFAPPWNLWHSQCFLNYLSLFICCSRLFYTFNVLVLCVCHGTAADYWAASTPSAEPSHQSATCWFLGTNFFLFMYVCLCDYMPRCAVPPNPQQVITLWR